MKLANAYTTDKLNEFLKKYTYQQKLTERLDHLENTRFDQPLINEIVLWKVNRYMDVDHDYRNISNDLETIKMLKPGQHKEGINILRKKFSDEEIRERPNAL